MSSFLPSSCYTPAHGRCLITIFVASTDSNIACDCIHLDFSECHPWRSKHHAHVADDPKMVSRWPWKAPRWLQRGFKITPTAPSRSADHLHLCHSFLFRFKITAMRTMSSMRYMRSCCHLVVSMRIKRAWWSMRSMRDMKSWGLWESWGFWGV